jgi:hypothetical protein
MRNAGSEEMGKEWELLEESGRENAAVVLPNYPPLLQPQIPGGQHWPNLLLSQFHFPNLSYSFLPASSSASSCCPFLGSKENEMK